MIKLFILPALLLLFSGPASASIDKDMKEFWENSGGISNVNKAGAYEAQSAGYYTLGGIYARTPVKNTQVASISMPSMKAGCGGINLFNGGFSFINSDELIKVLKAIPNNASGFAMQLALETISPVIAEKIEELQSWIQRVNAMNINSCEAASNLVGGMWPRHERASHTICSTLANNSGLASDFVKARHECYNDRSGSHNKLKNNSNYDKLMVEDINLAWKAIKDAGFFNIEGNDRELAELFMTLSGTIIIKSDNNTPKYEYITARAPHNDIIQILMEGGSIKYHKCTDIDKCLNILREGGNHTISTNNAFKAKVEKMINSITEKIMTDTPISEEEKKFINNKSSVPLYLILNIYAAYSGAGALFELPAYTEAIALKMLYEYLNDVLRQVETASDTLIIASEDHTKKFKENIREARRSLTERELKTHQTYATLMKLVDRAMVIEGILAKQIGSPIAESFNWSKSF